MATEAPQQTATTEYVVLGKTTSGSWAEEGTAKSATRQGAVQEVAAEREGAWKAVPLRSWRPTVNTRTEQITKTRVEVVEG